MDQGIKLSELIASGGKKQNHGIKLSELLASGTQDKSPGIDGKNSNPSLPQSTAAPAFPRANHELRAPSSVDRFIGRISDAFNSRKGLTENLITAAGDRLAPREFDPGLGRHLSEEETAARRTFQRQQERERLAPEQANSNLDVAADLIGHIGREASDPIALAAAPVGGGAGPVISASRAAKLGAAGLAYEGAAEAADQAVIDGKVNDYLRVAQAGAAGAVGAVGLDVFIRGIGAGIRHFRSSNNPDAEQLLLDQALDIAEEQGFNVDEVITKLEHEAINADTSLLDGLPSGQDIIDGPLPASNDVPAEGIKLSELVGADPQTQKVIAARSVDADLRSRITALLPGESVEGVVPRRVEKIGLVSPEQANALRDSGLETDLSGFQYSIDNEHISKILKKHSRDPIPVTNDDFLLVPDIVKSPDSLTYRPITLRNTKQQVDGIFIRKQYDGDEYVLEMVTNVAKRHSQVKIKSLYKIPKSADDSFSTNDVGTSPVPYAQNASSLESPAARIVPQTEFGNQITHAPVDSLPVGTRTAVSPEEIAHVVAPFRKDAQESFVAVVTDEAGSVLNVARVHRGTADQVNIDPTLVAGSVVNTPGAKRAYIAHNHPTGDVNHSSADVDVSTKVENLLNGTGVEFGGSIVVGDGGRVFGHLKGDIDETLPTTALPRNDSLPITERRIGQRLPEADDVQSVNDAREALNVIAGDKEGVLLVDTANKPLRFVQMSSDELKHLRTNDGEGSAKLLREIDKSNADGFIVRSNDPAAVGNLNGFADATGKRLIDAFDDSGQSAVKSKGIPEQSTFYANPFAPAAKFLVDSAKQHTGRVATEAAAGGVIGGISSDYEAFSPNWWLDVGAGSLATVAALEGGRHAKLLGKGSYLDKAVTQTGEAISKIPFLGNGPKELSGLKARQRAMQDMLDGEVTDIAQHLKNFSPEERAVMSDLIEGKGIVADLNHVHQAAAELDKFVTAGADKAKELGLIPESVDTGGYLHRYYEKWLNPLDKDASFKEASGQSISGKYTIARGTDSVVNESHVSPGVQAADDGAELIEALVHEDGSTVSRYFLDGETLPDGAQVLDREWSIRGRKDGEVLIHRDWTTAEREAWGEIKDAGYRFVRGMAELNHDISLGTLYREIANNDQWAKKITGSNKNEVVDGQKYIYVPKTKVGSGSKLTRYGQLAGKHVRADVWNGIARYGKPVFAPGSVGQTYRRWLGKWKTWATVYNPVSHLNNTFSNVEMLYLSGYTPKDLASGVRHFAKGLDSDIFKIAQAEGLLDADLASSFKKGPDSGYDNSLKEVADSLLAQKDGDVTASIDALMSLKDVMIRTDKTFGDKAVAAAKTGKALLAPVAKVTSAAAKPINSLGKFARKAYQTEDVVFKLAVLDAELKKGATVSEAANAARRSFFDYSDLPDAVRTVRDLPIGSPFISYTYFAVPAIVRNVVEKPERALALFAAFEAMNYAGLATNTENGIQPGEYWDVSRADEALSSPWDKGRSIAGVRNTINVPFADGMKLSLARAHAGGNPFTGESGNRKFSVPGAAGFWGSDIFGSNPSHLLLDVIGNEDWKGQKIYEPGDSDEEKRRKALAYVYQGIAPKNALTPGSYHNSKILNGLANSENEVVQSMVQISNGVLDSIGLGQITGENRAGKEINTRDAVLSSFGVKLREVDHGRTLKFSRRDTKKALSEKDSAARKILKQLDSGKLTRESAEKKLQEINRDRKELTEHFNSLSDSAKKLKANDLFTTLKEP